MGFSKMVKFLQEKNPNKIVICSIGNFYISVGKDATLLNKIAKLKISCTMIGLCKVGFPISSLEKYTNIIKENDYGYIVYCIDRNTEELIVKESYEGKNNITEKNNNKGCSKCKDNFKHKEKDDIYLKALAKMYNLDIDTLL